MWLSIVVHFYNPSTYKIEAGRTGGQQHGPYSKNPVKNITRCTMNLRDQKCHDTVQGYEKSQKKWYNLLFPTCQSHTEHYVFRDKLLPPLLFLQHQMGSSRARGIREFSYVQAITP